MDYGVSGDLIVTDGKTEVTRFKEVIEDDNLKRIAVNVSGGTDSPLVIYFIAKFISQTKKYDKEIFPHFMVDTGNMLTIAPTLVPKQIDVIRGLFPDVTIHDVYTQDFRREEDWNDDLKRYIAVNKEGRRFKSELYDNIRSASLDGIKNLYCEPLKKTMWEVLKPDVLLNGKTSNLPNSILKLYEVFSEGRAREAGETDKWPQDKKDRSPWYKVDKRFIGHQYRKENLMDNLFPLTESCLVESSGELVDDYGCEPDAYPCKKCHQCIEKFVAFGMYDKCWTK